MKNTKKLIGLATAVLAIASLAACGGTKGSDSKGGAGSSKCTHKYVEVKEESVAATCTTEGKKVTKCEKCGDKKETKVSKAAHQYEDQEGGKAATCTEAGEKVQKCKVCGEVKKSTVEALGHDYVDDADQSGAKKVTCTEDGEKLQHCSRCKAENKEVVPATGHTFGADEWTTPATCEKPGAGTHKCETCGTVQDITADALGHDVQLVGDDTEPEPGKAKVRVYECQRDGCDTTYLGFKASEVTAASKETLVINDEGGARFFGHPIGNDVALDDTGSADRDSHEAVYNKEQKGDFFEYVFDLTADQAAKLQACKLVCDAKPADYMGQNNVDFWAVRGDASSDWTYGMYIDDDPEHLNEDGTGKIVEDFRYVLYVDDKIQTLDSDVTTRVARGDPRGEYTLPFTFKLHAGENKIRLVMAGGYRSVFYNFTFRAVEAPADEHTHKFVAGEKAATSALRELKCECGETNGYEMVAADLTEGQKAPVGTNKDTRLGKGIFDDVWNITGIPAGKYDLYINAQASAGNATKGYWNSATAVSKGDSAKNNGGDELSKLYKYQARIDDGEYVNMGSAEGTYADFGLTESEGNWTNAPLATLTVANGAKTLTIHNLNNGYSIWVYGARLVKAAA